MLEELFSIIFFFIVIGTPFCGGQHCSINSQYDYNECFCEGIVHRFPENDYYYISRLGCNRCHINHFDNETFPYGNHFERFTVSNSDIKYIGERSFQSLQDLKYLFLHKNQIRNISKGAFEGSTELYELHLESNFLVTIESGVFRGLSANLVNISDNTLEYLPAHAFDEIMNLRNLDLSRNQLTKLDKDTFEDLSNLETLDLSSNLLCQLPPEVFKPLSALKSLTLANNQFRTIEPGTLRGISADFVNISNNALEYLPAHAFDGIIKLRNLDLSRNQLTKLDKDTFEDLSNLETLDLSSNLLCHLPLGVFKSLSSLNHLTLAFNKFTRLSRGIFSGLTHIKYLSLAQNSLTEFNPPVLLSMNYLTELDVSSNNIRNFDAQRLVSHVPTLRVIAFEENIFTCDKLEEQLQYFQSNSITVRNKIFRFDYLNINGIACTNFLDLELLPNLDSFLEQSYEDARVEERSCSL